MYKIVLLSEANKFYKKLFYTDRRLFQRIDNALGNLRHTPFIGKPLKDKLKGRYSLRVGVYRIIYSVSRREIIVYILDIGHRKEIYR
ncbi:MAG: type II toxin-antitoxin system RelE/ParE family toxin [Candidatus Omnitrophica bacterium]|nr:type II toxin-antitoxin system RelE/ParE family toxin [Candidatus Omnitrophota bacterium]MBU4479694.1 type II toxin-antitoxin system RelE/ParE family toxin [Candidatus Omnitrophota bacterium]